ncbi:MAG: DUF1361 domain-containing protein [Thermoflexibacteraceae bacterium]
MNTLNHFFIRKPLWGLLFLSICFSGLLLLVRIAYIGELKYIFLAWNLFLAAIPLAISRVLVSNHLSANTPTKLLLGATWLLFFPNAPYIITDFVHLNWLHQPVPYWYDILMLMLFAWNGLLMGLLSLNNVHYVIEHYFPPIVVKLGIVGVLFLGSFGIYLGRVLRWNSWDILTNPFSLCYDILQHIRHPFLHLHAWAMTICFTAFLLLAYLSIYFVKEYKNLQKTSL